MEKRGELKKLVDLFNSVYLIEDKNIVKMLLATLTSQYLPGDPVWIMIVAPSGGAKSEFINSIALCPNVFPLSTLTANTFISGQRPTKDNPEPSLLFQIGSGIITFKDFTSVLSERQDDRAIIMAQLREIYDGKYTKSFGTGKSRSWTGKLTVIAGTTYAIHSKKAQYTSMGERFLFYNMIQPERIEAADKAMENQADGKINEKRASIAEAVRKYVMETYEVPPELPRISAEYRKEILLLAELSTRARSDVERNWRSPQQEITEVYPPEMPTRVATQLQNFSISLSSLNWNETGKSDMSQEDFNIINKFTLDSVSKSRRTAMQELARYEMITTSGLATKLGFPTNSVRRWLEDLVALEIAERYKGIGNRGDKWNILPRYRDIISKFDNIRIEGGALDSNSVPENDNKIPSEWVQEANEVAKHGDVL